MHALPTRSKRSLSLDSLTSGMSACCRHGVQKNGIHYGDNDVAPYNLADSTRLAEAYRLIASVAAGGKRMFTIKLAPLNDTRVAFAVADKHNYNLFLVNEDEATPLDLELNLQRWDPTPGAMAVVSLVATGCVRFPAHWSTVGQPLAQPCRCCTCEFRC